ncbi:MAG: DUF11 domain-containing protein [Dehalococcoidia bacterium]
MYALSIINLGPATATGVALSDTLPSTVRFDHGVFPGGTCSRAAIRAPVTCPVGTLAPNGTVTVYITVTPQQPGSFVNTATVQNRAQQDPDPRSNTARETTTVQ